MTALYIGLISSEHEITYCASGICKSLPSLSKKTYNFWRLSGKESEATCFPKIILYVPQKLTVNRQLVDWKSTVKYLGIKFDKRNRRSSMECAPHVRFKQIEQIFSRTLHSAMNIPWFIKNEHILKETGLP